MDWDKLRIFHATAQAGSFTHAGSTLGLSQSAVSRHISQLERNLKTKLFHRHARGLILTEQGEVLYRTAREVFSKISLTEANISEGTRRPRGPLKVTATNGFAMVWITPNLAEFMDLYPEIELTLVLTDSEVDLSMREADLAIRVYRPSQPDLVQRHLMTVAHQVYASPEYLERHGTPQTIEDLNNHRLAVYGERAKGKTGLLHPQPFDLRCLLAVGGEEGGHVGGAELADDKGEVAGLLGLDLLHAGLGAQLGAGVGVDLGAGEAPADAGAEAAQADEAGEHDVVVGALAARGDDHGGDAGAGLNAPDAAVAAEGELAAAQGGRVGVEEPHAVEGQLELLAVSGVLLDDGGELVHGGTHALAGGGGDALAFEGLEGELDAGLAREVGEGGEGVLGADDAGELPGEVAVEAEAPGDLLGEGRVRAGGVEELDEGAADGLEGQAALFEEMDGFCPVHPRSLGGWSTDDRQFYLRAGRIHTRGNGFPYFH